MRAAVVQLCSTDDLAENLNSTRIRVAEAAAGGARLVALPENFAYMRREGSPFPCAQGPNGDLIRFLLDLASDHGIWLLGGSFPEAIPGDRRVYNTSILVSPQGEEVARYRKIHLFDVDIGEQAYRESDHFAPGEKPVVGQTEFGGVGLSICYDLRFPELYRAHVEMGARFIAVPSAFMPETGRAHWEILLRARAIESQTFVLAPAQCGSHSADRASHGHSMIISPWGDILAEIEDKPGIIEAECDLDALDRIRRDIPALNNRRLLGSDATAFE